MIRPVGTYLPMAVNYYWLHTTRCTTVYYQVEIESLTRTDPVIVPYIVEPKGEAVAWDYHGNGYFTLGEGHDQTLYYYRRIKETDVVG
jgi:hypothetical protein